MRLAFISLLLSVVSFIGNAGAAVVRYDSLADWSAAAGGSGQLQDFSSYAANTDMKDVEFLPGVKATTNLDALDIRIGGSGDPRLFATSRNGTEESYYDIQYALPYLAVALEIVSFERGDSGSNAAGLLRVTLADGGFTDFSVFALDPVADIFVGFVSDVAITGIRWYEPLENNGLGREETALDDFRVQAVPEPGTALLALAGLAALGWTGRRHRRG